MFAMMSNPTGGSYYKLWGTNWDIIMRPTFKARKIEDGEDEFNPSSVTVDRSSDGIQELPKEGNLQMRTLRPHEDAYKDNQLSEVRRGDTNRRKRTASMELLNTEEQSRRLNPSAR